MILLLFGIAIIATLFYYYCIKPMSYWKNLGVPQTEPIWFFGDSWRNILRYQNVLELIDYLYYGSGNGRYGGCYTFTTPTLIIKDPELTKQILVKDFDHFVDHYLFQGSDYDPLWGKNLIALKGEKWREMRSILSPCFTSSKMKAMFKLMLDCAERFTEYFQSLSVAEQTENQAIPQEMKETFTRYATDVVASTAFGVEVDSLNEPNNSFYLMGRRVTSFGFWKAMRFFMNILLPKVCAIFRIRFLDDETMSFFIGVVEETIKVREEKGIVRPDMIHLMMEARKGKPKVEEGAADDETSISHVDVKTPVNITNMDIAAQAMIFFFGGFETSSNLMSFLAYELAADSDVQSKLRTEIEDTWNECNGKLTYEALLKMKYLDMVISETLRKWPVNLATDRLCTKPYTIEPAHPNEKPLHLKKGSYVSFPTYSIQHDPKYFPDPDKFDPERFSSENAHKIVPYTYLPFGGGPRVCIGNRFALLETKTLFFYLLKSFEIVFIEKSCVPLVISKKDFNLVMQGGNWLGFKSLKKGA
ncbi:unnamed protein product [Acanthoscelides obtectus]|uniref:Cytochrome P450 n=2 Tax=Acanthoscelides obtectus TaxID=200917 RepID=A0A9P0MEI1_ACAOB|nr:unnamed protein product [Acanthoscelides obtectus]CAK1644133.1 Cytochrome P450 9e2 [Acanthoscelides obtectus]